MKRRNEVPFIIGLCMVSMLAFSSSLFLEGAHGAALKQQLGSQWHSVTQAADGLIRGFGRTSQTSASPATAQVASSSQERKVAQGGTANDTSSNAPAPKLSQADINHLAKIANEVLSTTTQQEWTEAATAVANDKPVVAETEIAAIFAPHIKPKDLDWLATKFTGSAAFGLQDVKLLQQTLAEALAELTPQEQQLLQQGLAKYAGSQLSQANG